MEDVAPPWEVGSSAIIDQAYNTESANCQPVSGTSHQKVSSSSPPAPPSQNAECAMSDSYSNGFDCSGYPRMHGDHQGGPPRMHYQSPESSYSSRVSLSKNMPRGESCNFQHRPYPSSHPPPPPSHHYSYLEPDHHTKPRRECPPYNRISHYTPERTRPAPPCEYRDNWRYHPRSSSHGPRYDERQKGHCESSTYNGHRRESGRFQNQRWSQSPRAYNNRQSFQYKPHLEGPVPVGMRDPAGTWHQR